MNVIYFWAVGMTQVVEYLAVKCKALSSNSSTTNKEKEEKKNLRL
jgi:hypothetical protein